MQKGFGQIQFLLVLLVVIGGVGYAAYNVTEQTKRSIIEAANEASEKAAVEYFKDSPQASQANQPSPTTAQTNQTPGSSSVNTAIASKTIVGNASPSVAPVLSPNIPVPKTSIQSIQTFFSAIKSGDFVTANSLMGPRLANSIAQISGTSDPTKALSTCQTNPTCKMVLSSFQPPSTGYTTKQYTAKAGNKGEQISFPLSKSNPTLAKSIGDYNIDVFSEEYAGNIWVIQDVFINGQPLQNFF